MKEEMTDLIGVYDDSLDLEFCQNIIAISNQSAFYPRRNVYQFDNQIVLDDNFPGVVDTVYNNCLIPCLSKYVERVPYLQTYNFVSSAVCLMKTEPPSGGYHVFHAENIPWVSIDRVLAWMVYLNDVEKGGETEFLYQQRRFIPKAGTTLVWPASFTHLHRGNPPYSTKYTLTGWWHSDIGLRVIRK